MLKQQGPNCLNTNNSTNPKTECLSSSVDDEKIKLELSKQQQNQQHNFGLLPFFKTPTNENTFLNPILIQQLSQAFASYKQMEETKQHPIKQGEYISKIKTKPRYKKNKETENSGSYSSSTSPSVSTSTSSSSSSSPSSSPQPEKSDHFFKTTHKYPQAVLNPYPSHSCYTLPNTSSYNNQQIPKSQSSASISNQVKQKLKNCILQKLKNSNAKIESTPTLHHPQPIHPLRPKFQPPPPQPQPAKLEPIEEDSFLRRTTSEPNLKVKSALKDRLLEKRNLLSPFANKRPKFESKNQSQEIIIAAAIAAATAAITQQQTNPNIIQQIALIQHQLLNKSLSNQSEQMALAQAIMNQKLIPSSVSYPNLRPYEPQKPVTETPKFGHMVHVEEENEILLENELKNVAKQNETDLNRTIYNEQSTSNNTNSLSRSSSVQFEHRHKKYFNYMIQREQSKQLDNRYFSDPHLLRSIQMSNQFCSVANLHHQQHQQQQPCDVNLKSLENVEQKQYKYTTGLVYDPIMLRHECTCKNSQVHLETPDRIRSIWNRIKSTDLDQDCELVPAKLASLNDLLIGHNEQYALIFGTDIEQRMKLPKEYLQAYMMNVCMAPCRGLALKYDLDNSWNEEYTPLACRVAIGSTYELASLVANNKLKNGFAIVRPPGSHAEYNKPLGFCYFNTVGIVAKMLKKNLGLERILIVDWDVHHGNGTQQMTYNDPNIMYISLHRHDNGNFFPGTGSVDECGQDLAEGTNINIPWNTNLNPPIGDVEYLAAFRSIVMPIAKAFNPQITLVSCGFDATEQHPKELGGFRVTPTCFAYMTKKLMSLSDGKLVLALEGGYDIKSLCDSSELCLHALMNKQIPPFSKTVLDNVPNSLAIKDLENVVEIQQKYWPEIKNFSKYVRMSHNEYINVYTD